MLKKIKRQLKHSAFKYTMGHTTFWIALAVIIAIILVLIGIDAFLKAI